MKEISIDEIKGFSIGHAQDIENATGVSVILCKEGATAGVDVRGGGPATRETDLLNPKNMVQQIHAVTLSGGSAFGLEASSGVMQYLSENNIGFNMKDITIPIVCQASLFDCSVGNAKAYPDKAMGYQATQNADANTSVEMGNIGAGTGASVGKFFGFEYAMKSGLGISALQVGDLQVGAIVAVNACGDVFEANSTIQLAGPYNEKLINTEDHILDLTQTNGNANTTIGTIITNAKLDKAQMNKLASISHNGYAHTIRPVHTYSDGDTIFAMTTGKVEVNPEVVGIVAVKAMEKAIVNAIKQAKPAYGLQSYQSIQ